MIKEIEKVELHAKETALADLPKEAIKEKKINKSEFIREVSCFAEKDPSEVEYIYNAMTDAIALFTANGYRVSLAGFGVFSVKQHKGHPIQFKKTETDKHGYVDDYAVLRFSASDIFMKKIKDIRNGMGFN